MNTLVINATTGEQSTATRENPFDPVEYARKQALTRLAELDTKVPRALEDVVRALAIKGALPLEVQAFIEAKQAERAKL